MMFTRISRATQFAYSKLTNQLELTPKAIEIIQLRQKKGIKGSTQKQFLRLEIQAGEGCQGFRYKFNYDSNLKQTDLVLEEAGNVLFAVEGENIKLMRGSTIDHEDKMMRSAFYVKENPMAEVSCSCKTSFAPKQQALKQ